MCRPLFHYPHFLHISLPNKSDFLAAPNKPRTLLFLLFYYYYYFFWIKKNQEKLVRWICHPMSKQLRALPQLEFEIWWVNHHRDREFGIQSSRFVAPKCFANFAKMFCIALACGTKVLYLFPYLTIFKNKKYSFLKNNETIPHLNASVFVHSKLSSNDPKEKKFANFSWTIPPKYWWHLIA